MTATLTRPTAHDRLGSRAFGRHCVRTLAPVQDVTRRDLLKGIGALGAGWALAGCGADGDNERRATGPTEPSSGRWSFTDDLGNTIELDAGHAAHLRVPASPEPLDDDVVETSHDHPGLAISDQLPLTATPDGASVLRATSRGLPGMTHRRSDLSQVISSVHVSQGQFFEPSLHQAGVGCPARRSSQSCWHHR